MVCIGLLTTIRTAALRGCVVVDAGLASGIAGLELVGVPGDSGWVSVPGVPVLGVWDSEPVWARAGKASIAPNAATLRKRQCLRKADRRI
jgi:hypothetical protein